MSKTLHDGSKIYDTPKYNADGCLVAGAIQGYNGGFASNYPSVAVGSNLAHTRMWERRLFKELLSVLNFEIPPEWDRDFVLWTLFRNGYFAILKDCKVKGENGKTLYTANIAQPCGIAGRNVYYQPTRVIVANPRIDSKTWTIGKDCAIIKLTPDWQGVWDIVHYYAEILAGLSQSLKMAIANTRMADGFAVESKAAADTVKAFNDSVDKGISNIIVLADTAKDKDGKLVPPWAEFHTNVGHNYIIDKLLADTESTLNEFRRCIGVPILSDKKERQITIEVNTIVGTALTQIDVYYDCLSRSIEEAKKLFPGLGFSVSKPNYAGGEQ